ncbi:MAG: FecR domain-containing protein [Candidatus Rokuibacteriota bacterium]
MTIFRTSVFAMAATLLSTAVPAVTAAEPEESAGVVTTVNGNATLTRAAKLAQPVSLRMLDEIFVRDRIDAHERSLVRMLQGGKARITVRELSVLTITEEAGRVTVDLQSGKVGVAVVKSRMRPGEVIEIRSPNATAAVRGTVFVVQVDPSTDALGGPAITTSVHLLRGLLDVSVRGDVSQKVRLGQLQSVVVTDNHLGPARPIPQDAVAAITADLEPRQRQHPTVPKEFAEELLAREQDRAGDLGIELLQGPDTGFGSPSGSAGAPAATSPTGFAATGGGGLGGANGGVGGAVAGVGGAVGGAVSTLGGAVGGAVSGVGGAFGGTVGGYRREPRRHRQWRQR